MALHLATPARRSSTSFVDQAKLRWRIERDYQELKQEIGLGHYEGRGWRGFHHHATLAIAAYGFLVSERSRTCPLRAIAPSRTSKRLRYPKVIDPAAPPLCPGGTSPIQSPPSASDSLTISLGGSHDVPVVIRIS